MICLISLMFCEVYKRQFHQSLDGPEINPSRSHRKSVARDTSNSSQTSIVLYRFCELPCMLFISQCFQCTTNFRKHFFQIIAAKYSQYILTVKQTRFCARGQTPHE